jgi:serine protease Do
MLSFLPTGVDTGFRAEEAAVIHRPILRFRYSVIAAFAACVATCPMNPAQAAAAASPIDAEAYFAAIVKVQVRALPDARSTATLGAEREGTGVVIDEGGLVVTVGYLVVEADDVNIVDDHGRSLPAKVVAYDHATGLGLVRLIPRLDVAPLKLGDSSKLAESDPVLIVNHAGLSDASRALVVSRRPFTGSWEYLLDHAIYTAPPALNWSGAALIGRDGALLGVGSLIVREAAEGDIHLPGNMFIPVEALKPVLAELVKNGRRAGPARPWLGVAAEEVQGRLIVARVSPEGPADRAGVQSGDIILAVGGEGVRSQAEFYRKVWGRGAAGSEIPLRVLQGIELRDISVRSMDRVDYFRKKPNL